MISAVAETLRKMPTMGNKVAYNPAKFEDENLAIAFGMGITA